MTGWQQEYNSDPDVQNLSKNFDKFKTVDWRLERLNENRKYFEALKHRSNNGIHRNDLTSNDNFNDLEDNSRFLSGQGLMSRSAISLFYDISNLQLIKSRFWTTVQIWIVLTIVGIIIGTIAAFLSVLTEWLCSFKIGYCSADFFLNKTACPSGSEWIEWSEFPLFRFFIFTILSILFGLIPSLLCLYFSPNAAGSGISEVKCIVSGFDRPDFLSFTTLFVKALSLPFTIASGLAVGKEGPSVHYASCVGNSFGRFIIPWFKESPLQMSDIITAAAGSGVAVAFGSPIGGVLFSVEEISSGLKLGTLWKTFYTSLIAITTLQIWNPFGTGQIVMFEVRYDSDWVWSETVWFIVLGIFGGLYGIIISKFNIKYVAFRQRYLSNWKFSGVTEVFWLCLITSIVGYWNIYMRLDMTKVMEMLFDECSSKSSNDNAICLISKDATNTTIYKWLWTLFTLLYATIVRMILVCISYGCKVPCGIFVPSMAVGATFGKFLGLLVEQINDNDDTIKENLIGIPSGTYAFLGAGAALSGVTGLTVTVVVIMYELTGAIKYIIPSMITIIVVRVVNEFGSNGFGGIADQMIKFNGMPFIDVKEEHDFGETVVVGEIMVPQIIGIDCKGMYERDIEKILQFGKREYPLLYKRQDVIGVIKRENIVKILDKVKNNKSLITNNEDETVINLSNEFVKFLSSKKIYEITGEVQTEEIGSEEGGGRGGEEEEEEETYEGYVQFEYLSMNLVTPVYTLLDLFVNVGVRIVFVENEGKTVGVVTRKDLIKYENYMHFKEHGDVFVNEKDKTMFVKMWRFYSHMWRIISFWNKDERAYMNLDLDSDQM